MSHAYRSSSARLQSSVAGLVILAGSMVLTSHSVRADSANEWLSKAFPRSGDSRADGQSHRRSSRKGVQVASLGDTYMPSPARESSLSGGGVKWAASSSCLNSTLRSAIHSIAAQFGSVTVSSTCRSSGHNRRVGGAHRSHHLTGDAADFRVRGNWGGAYAALKSMGSLGGIKHYGGGLFHIDTGPRRSW